jgi:hypothetical protein
MESLDPEDVEVIIRNENSFELLRLGALAEAECSVGVCGQTRKCPAEVAIFAIIRAGKFFKSKSFLAACEGSIPET